MYDEIEVTVTANDNNTALVTFNPSETSWIFPKNNRLKLFNKMNVILEKKINGEIKMPMTDESLEEIKVDIQNILKEWIACGDVVIMKGHHGNSTNNRRA